MNSPKYTRTIDGVLCMTVMEHEALLAQAVAAEREACAALCDELDKNSQSQWPQRIATMIRLRARSEGGAA